MESSRLCAWVGLGWVGGLNRPGQAQAGLATGPRVHQEQMLCQPGGGYYHTQLRRFGNWGLGN